MSASWRGGERWRCCGRRRGFFFRLVLYGNEPTEPRPACAKALLDDRLEAKICWHQVFGIDAHVATRRGRAQRLRKDDLVERAFLQMILDLLAPLPADAVDDRRNMPEDEGNRRFVRNEQHAAGQ